MFDKIKEKYLSLMEKESLPYIKCKSCGHVFFYPRDFCPRCNSRDLEVKISEGKGKVFSFTKFQGKKGETIYGIVELDEGFRMYTNIFGDVDIGDEVIVTFINDSGRKIPVFKKK
jgi:uncharacterized OB-fold protein